MKRTRKNGRTKTMTRKMGTKGRKGQRRLRSPSEATTEMRRIMALRGRGKSLLEACKEVGVSVQTYYYRLNHAVYAGGRGQKARGPGLGVAPASAKKLLSGLDRFQKAVSRLRTTIETTMHGTGR